MRKALSLLAPVLLVLLAGCASLAQEKSDLAPTGRLRAAINYGNPVLASRGPGGGPGGKR